MRLPVFSSSQPFSPRPVPVYFGEEPSVVPSEPKPEEKAGKTLEQELKGPASLGLVLFLALFTQFCGPLSCRVDSLNSRAHRDNKAVADKLADFTRETESDLSRAQGEIRSLREELGRLKFAPCLRGNSYDEFVSQGKDQVYDCNGGVLVRKRD